MKGTVEKTRGGIRLSAIDEICKQIEPYLPIKSLDDLAKKVTSFRIGSHVIPLKLIAPHIGTDSFPVKDLKDLKSKVSEGVERAATLGRMSQFGRRNALFDNAMGELTQTEAKIGLRRPAILDVLYPK